MPTSPTAPTVTSPDTPAGPRRARPWYRKQSVLIPAVVVVFIVVTVLTDLPTNNSRSSNLNTARSVIAEISTDVKPCNLGLTEALGFYTDVTTGHITATHRAQIPGLIRDDLQACSYTNADIVDLASVDNPSSAVGKQLNVITNNALNWCDPDALAAIGEITTLINTPGNTKAHTQLLASEHNLQSDRALALRNIAKLAKYLGSSMHSQLRLVQVP